MNSMILLIHQPNFYVRVSMDMKRNHKEKLDYLIQEVARLLDLTPEMIKAKSRKRELVMARQFVCYAAYVNGYGSLKFIANEIGGLHYSTIIHGRDTVKDLVESKNREFMIVWNACRHLTK